MKIIKTYLVLFFLSLVVFSQAQTVTKNIKEIKMNNTINKYGIEGQKAPELQVSKWIDSDGKDIAPVTLDNYKGKFLVVYCFQAWCPGCHSIGLPSLQKMTESLKDNEQVEFLAVQTVFEGYQANTFERLKEIQKEYKLNIPFGHDVGDESTHNISLVMKNYRTGGTPWFIFIDQDGKVVFNDFHLNTEKAIEYLKEIR